MQTAMSETSSHRLGLRAGEWVRVRTKEEVLATLDAKGRLEELPLLPAWHPILLARDLVETRLGKRGQKGLSHRIVVANGGRRLHVRRSDSLACERTFGRGEEATTSVGASEGLPIGLLQSYPGRGRRRATADRM